MVALHLLDMGVGVVTVEAEQDVGVVSALRVLFNDLSHRFLYYMI
jgi:hypothetical protein